MLANLIPDVRCLICIITLVIVALGNASKALSQKVNGEAINLHIAKRRSQEPMFDKLPEDIMNHIYSLLPMQDAARAACVSRKFLHCWRHYPRLVFDYQSLGWKNFRQPRLQGQACNMDEVGSSIVRRIDHILKNHSGFGLKVFILRWIGTCYIDACHLDRWLEIVVKPGIEELALNCVKQEYNFPSLLLSNETGATIQSVRLSHCAFHPTLTRGCNKSLTSLDLCSVHITGEELVQFLSNCPALMRLVISRCNDMICFRVPCPLQQLDYLEVTRCKTLQVIQLNAPKLSTFIYGEAQIPLSLGDQLGIKNVHIISYEQDSMIYYACTEVLSLMPNVERLVVTSPMEEVDRMPSKFLRLTYLEISVSKTFYFDFFSLVPLLDAAPALETFIFCVNPSFGLRNDSIIGDFDGDQPI